VDNVWRYSKDYPTCIDGKGNINNIIECKKSNIVFNLADILKNRSNDDKLNCISKNQKGDNSNSRTVEKSNTIEVSDYNCVFPKRNEIVLSSIKEMTIKEFTTENNLNYFSNQKRKFDQNYLDLNIDVERRKISSSNKSSIDILQMRTCNMYILR
jgi:hypothetical protein